MKRLEPRIGIALGSGSARGLAHIAYIEALDEMGLTPSVIAGSSMGALIGAACASGMKGADLRDYAVETAGSLRALGEKYWTNLLARLRTDFLSGFSMQLDPEMLLEAFLPRTVPDTFEALDIPLYVIATDLTSLHQSVFNEGALRTAIAGSMAVPSLFRPVQLNGQLLVDGGAVNPVPLGVASHGADIVIGIDVNGDIGGLPADPVPSPIDVGLSAMQVMMMQMTRHMQTMHPAEVFVTAPLGTFKAYEFWRVREIIEAAEATKDQFKRDVSAQVEAFIAGPGKTF